jgi:EAL domain-containing protein (putative c-di-GMP-specific phosphodiesterase class I)/DNA-binding response OmpR family regulator
MAPPMRILVADDEPDLRDLLRINLEAQGYEVQLAGDGLQALAMAMAQRPDLIVLDVMMPGLDGLEVLRQLRRQPANADLPIVLLSARSSDAEVFEGWSSGANYYITKPFELDELLDFVQQVRVQSRHAPEEGGDLDVAFNLGVATELMTPRLDLRDARERHRLEMDLQGALGAGQFFLSYQPSFDLRNVAVTGVEALIRWRHPLWGTVQPADFIPVLEHSGLMLLVGRWVLLNACRQAAIWCGEGYKLNIAVNISAGQFESPDLAADVLSALERSGLDAGSLVIDIPEAALRGDQASLIARLSLLKQLGVRVAVDDFGVGNLPASVLSQLPVDILKIHRSFTSEMTGSGDSAEPMRAILDIGRTFGLETLAKGIEKQDQLMQLQREVCDGGQGFLYGRSMDVEQIGELLKTWAIRAGVADSRPKVSDLPALDR